MLARSYGEETLTAPPPLSCGLSRLHEPALNMKSTYPLLKKWTTEQHERLVTMAEAGWRPSQISAELNRSEAAIRVRAWQYGIVLRLVTTKRIK